MSTQLTDSAKKASSNILTRQVAQYSLAAAVAGVSMLALTQPAAGEVVVTKKTILIPFGIAGVGIDINHDGATDFRFFATYFSFSGTSLHVSGGGVAGSFYASALGREAKIGPSKHFSSSSFERIERATGGYLNHKFLGNWGDNLKNRYLGVRFAINGETHYGWIRLTITIPSDPTHFMTGTITGYAYETVPNKPILAGTASHTAKLDLPDGVQNQFRRSLGMLALGADALPRWRREEAVTSN